MYKILLSICVAFAFLNAQVVTKTTTKQATGEGYGSSYEEAVNKALADGITKMYGGSLKQNSNLLTNSLKTNKGTDYKKLYSEQISKASKGNFDTYEVISKRQSADGFHVKVMLKKTTVSKSYKAPGLKASSRRSISVFDSSMQEYRAMGERLKKHIITDLLDSRKFNVLDRDNGGYYAMEKAIIQSGNAANDEIYKLKNVLGSDYFLIFNIAAAQAKSKISNLTGKTSTKVELAVDYQVILFATAQVKFSNTLTMSVSIKDDIKSSENAIAKIAAKISQDILNAIYPLKIASMNASEAVFTQKLSVGDTYECFTQGKALKDSYTKESTGDSKIESKVGKVEITRADPKLSYAKVIDGTVKEGNICRPLGGGNGPGYDIGRDANYQTGENGGVSLGF